MKSNYLSKIINVGQKLIASSAAQIIRRNKKLLAIIIIFLFGIFLEYYLHSNPKLLQNVFNIGFGNILLLTLLYGGLLLTNVGMIYATIRLCNKKLPLKNSLFLTIYSTIINFFGPLQSGPVVRSIYLKSKIGLRIRDYTYAMLFYYFAYALINLSLLFINKITWLSILGMLITLIAIAISANRLGFKSFKRYVFYIFILTTLQVLVITFIYSIELNITSPLAHYSFMQTISYTAGANLSLFVSLTPGAIGFRETFLVLSQSLHNVPLGSIITAGIIDRAIYIVFLAMLFLLSSALHLKNIFSVNKKS